MDKGETLANIRDSRLNPQWKMKSSTTVLSHNLSITTSPANHGPGDDSQCFHLPDAKFEVFHQRTETNLVTGVLNAVLSPFAVMANLLIVLIILTRKSLQYPSCLPGDLGPPGWHPSSIELYM